MHNLFKSVKETLSKPAYIFWLLLFFILVLALAVWLPNISLLNFVISSDNFSLADKIIFSLKLFGSLKTNFSIGSLVVFLVIAFLSGLNFSMLVYYLSKKKRLGGFEGLGILGTISGIFGIGCLSCGSVILSSIFGFSATVAFLGYLPFGGREFIYLALALLVFSIYILGGKIQSPVSCRIKK